MQVALSDGSLSGRLSAGHSKPSTHLQLSPTKAKPVLMAPPQRSTALSLNTPDLSGYISKPSCLEGNRLASKMLQITSPPRTPLCNLTNSSGTRRELQLQAICNTRSSSSSSEQDLDQDSTESGFCTPVPSAPDCACSASSQEQELPTSSVVPSCIAKPVVHQLAANAAIPAPPAAVLMPNTPEISEAALNLRQTHDEEVVVSSASDSADGHLDKGAGPAGEIHLFLGPMFAGKSTSLLSKVRESIALGRSVATIKSHKDDRYANNFVVTHTGDRESCYAVPTLRAFKDQVPEAYKQCDVIAIDEGQFFTDLFEFSLHAADQDGKIVYIAGLDGDFKRQKFGSVLDLIPYADTVTKLHSNCAFCSKKGLFSLRISADTRQEVVGGADQYRPVCRQHYLQLSQTRSVIKDGESIDD